MSDRHSPAIRLMTARGAYQRAFEECPHWDYDSDGADYVCCRTLEAAQRELKLARKAAGKENDGV